MFYGNNILYVYPQFTSWIYKIFWRLWEKAEVDILLNFFIQSQVGIYKLSRGFYLFQNIYQYICCPRIWKVYVARISKYFLRKRKHIILYWKYHPAFIVQKLLLSKTNFPKNFISFQDNIVSLKIHPSSIVEAIHLKLTNTLLTRILVYQHWFKNRKLLLFLFPIKRKKERKSKRSRLISHV